MVLGVNLDSSDDFVDGAAAPPDRRSDCFQPAVQRVCVAVAEGRHEEPAGEVDVLTVHTGSQVSGLPTQRADDPPVGHQKGVELLPPYRSTPHRR